MFIKETINNFDELIAKFNPKEMELYLDANICIYIRDFIRQPQTVIDRDDETFWPELKNFFRRVKQHNIFLNYSFGIDEASRSKANFEVDSDKLDELIDTISQFDRMDYFEILEHSKLIANNPPAKDKTSISKTKVDSLGKNSGFQIMLHITYATLLKLYILDKTRQSLSNVELMMQYIDFLAEEIDIINGSSLAFAYHYLDKGKIKNLIHYSKKNACENVIHALWNAAIDLTLPALVSRNVKVLGRKTAPVFVTGDEKLWLLFNTLKVNILFTDHGQPSYSPIIELNLSQTNWKHEELETLKQYYYNKNRISKAFNKIDEFDFVGKMRKLSYGLEIEAKKYMPK
ncbi:hypothetical protein [Anaeroarcus burkinensis]|uniref:hypothetical protein n=1 Tax=Anaeroarcus burkinensis TaxID=82376 RepID=UPI001AEBCE5B|nr:hypothetical protein [Anaeroarcus burkinensis]